MLHSQARKQRTNTVSKISEKLAITLKPGTAQSDLAMEGK
jgi:hypothetical protein